MAKPMTTMMFGKYQGQSSDAVPTDYLVWVFGSFPKLRKKLESILLSRGLTAPQLKTVTQKARVLGKEPESDEHREERLARKRLRRPDCLKQPGMTRFSHRSDT